MDIWDEQATALKKKELELQAREAQLERSLKEVQRQREQVHLLSSFCSEAFLDDGV